MSYQKTTWAAGDEITSAKLNKIEDGVDGAVTKESFENAGIISKTYTTIMDETVTTVATTGYDNPYAKAQTTYNFDKSYMYRVTFDGTEYVLPCRLWWKDTSSSPTSHATKVYEFLGKLSLYVSTTGVPYSIDDVPFVIVNDMVSPTNSIIVLTQTAGAHTVKIEKIETERVKLPQDLTHGSPYYPINPLSNGGSTYDGLSIGPNTVSNRRGTLAIGNGNTVSDEFSTAIGIGNEVSGSNSSAVGSWNKVSGAKSFACGVANTITGANSFSTGNLNTSSGLYSFTEGQSNTASGYGAHAEGYSSSASATGSHSEGENTVASGRDSHAEGYYTTANHRSQHVFGQFNIADPSEEAATARGNYVEIVGNGTAANARSNARTLDWEGNERLAGGLTLGMGSNDEVTISAAQLKQLLALLT